MITLIVAHDQHRVIGNEGKIPWNIPEDLKHFKNTTINHTVLMGRKTYESIGRPLPLRTNVIVTHNPNFVTAYPEIKIITDLHAYLEGWPKEKQLFVIGGANLYLQALPYADEIIVSLIPGVYKGDTYFPIYVDQFQMLAEQPMPGFLIQVFRR